MATVRFLNAWHPSLIRNQARRELRCPWVALTCVLLLDTQCALFALSMSHSHAALMNALQKMPQLTFQTVVHGELQCLH